MTYARAVFPVPGCPPMRMARPAIFPSLIMLRIIPAALLASLCKMIKLSHDMLMSGRLLASRLKSPPFAPLARSRASTYLANHTLGYLAWVKTVVQTKTTDMGVSADTLDTGQVLDFLHFRVDS